MTEYQNYDFWVRYFQADEIEQLNIIKTLPIFTGMKNNAWLGTITPTLLNSYLQDIIEAYDEWSSEY